MNGELHWIRPSEIHKFTEIPPETFGGGLADFAKASRPLVAGIYGTELLCLIGFVPLPTSAQAYMWMLTRPAAERHKLVVGRWARKLIPMIQLQYPTIVGHCSAKSAKWLTSLGAQIDGNTFVIEANNG